MGCISAPIDRANLATKERLEQVDKAAKDRIAQIEALVQDLGSKVDKLDKSLSDTSKRWEEIAKSQSEKWEEQSNLWREQTKGFQGESEKWRAQSDLWRTSLEGQSELWRATLKEEAEKTRVFAKDLVESIPKIGNKTIGDAAAGMGLPTKTDDTGRTVIDWVAALTAIATGWQLFNQWKNVKNGKVRQSPEDIKKLVKSELDLFTKPKT